MCSKRLRWQPPAHPQCRAANPIEAGFWSPSLYGKRPCGYGGGIATPTRSSPRAGPQRARSNKSRREGTRWRIRWFFLIAAESAETTQACLARLEPGERELLTQKYVHRVSYQRIADDFGWSRHVAEYRVRLAKDKLRGLMLDVGLGKDA